MRKRAKVDDKLEWLSAQDTRRAIDHAEVVVLLLDATRGLEVQDLKIADAVVEEGRALVIAVNKWDVAENASSLFNGIKAALEEGLSQLKGVPVLTVSGKTGKGIDQILKVALELREAWSRRVTTGELNRWFEAAIEANPPPAPKGKRIKLRYITQVKSRPPSFVVFGNRVDELPESYRRYLLNALRRDLKLGPIPLRMSLRGSKNPFDQRPQGAISLSLPFSAKRTAWDHGRLATGPYLERLQTWTKRTTSSTGCISKRAGPSLARASFESSAISARTGPSRSTRSSRRCTTQNTVALVIPAHTLKGEARQFGAEPLAKLAELIESTARLCIETHRFPDELVTQVVELRRTFEQTVELFDRATNPLLTRNRQGGFGRKASNQDFGRI